MSGLAIYTDDYEPHCVYGAERTGDGSPERVRQAVRYGDAPLALLVDFDDAGGRVVWSFRGKRASDANRTEYFIADFTAEAEEPLFRAVASALRTLQDHGDWVIPPADDLRWDLGFDLWRLPADTPGLGSDERTRLFDRLTAGATSSSDGPAVFGMRTYRTAFQTVRALETTDVSCTVAVGTDGDPTSLAGVDLLLVPDAQDDFEPRSGGGAVLLHADSETDSDATAATHSTAPDRHTASQTEAADHSEHWSAHAPKAVAIAVLLVALGGVIVLYRGGASPARILTGNVLGVVVAGLLLGTDRIAVQHPRLATGVLGALGAVGGIAGGWALFHMLDIIYSGAIATLTAGAYLSLLVCLGLYTAVKAIVEGPHAIVPGIRSLVNSSLL